MIEIAHLPHIYKLARGNTSYSFKRGDGVTSTDAVKHLWLVEKGFVKRFEIMNTGAICVQGFYGPGDAFPLTYVFQALMDRSIYNGPEIYYYEAMCDTKLRRVSGEELKTAAKADPLVYKDLFSIAGNRFLSDIQLLESKGLPDANHQVAHLIIHYSERFGVKLRTGSIRIDLPLTQQDVADVLSLTRETVSMSIRKLREMDLIGGGRKLVVKDSVKLKAWVYE